MIYLLAILLLLIFVGSIFANKKDLTAPAVIFSSGFFFQSIWAVAFSKVWKLGLHTNTLLVIVLGVLEFAFVSFIIKKIIELKSKDRKVNSIEEIKISKIKEVLYLVFVLAVIALYLYSVVKAVGGSFGSIKSVLNSISTYDQLLKFTDEYAKIKLPFIISNLNIVVVASGYWFFYVIINNYLFNKKIGILELIIVLLTIVASVLSGSRTPAIMMIIAGISYFIILGNKKSNSNIIFNKKVIITLAIIGIVFLSTFLTFANVLGRNIKNNPISYLSIYCGAEVKNLDLFLQEKSNGTFKKENNIIGSQTFMNVVKTIGNKIGFKGYKEYRLDLPFRTIGKTELGNVYTTFYPFIYDFGYKGLVVLVLLMALISQLVYELGIRSKFKDYPNTFILIYGVIFGCLLLSFFSNKFYEEIFSMAFIKKLVMWVACDLFFVKLRFNKRREEKQYEKEC